MDKNVAVLVIKLLVFSSQILLLSCQPRQYVNKTSQLSAEADTNRHGYPDAPGSLNISQGPGENTPVVTVTGISSNDHIFLYGNSSCTMARGNARAVSSSVRIISSPLPAGNHVFYAKVERDGLTSPCSTARASWQIAPSRTPAAKSAFISTWRTNRPNERITLPLVETDETSSSEDDFLYNFTVDWGDGNSDTITSHDDFKRTHTYANAGTYEVTITGVLEAWSFEEVPESRDKLIAIPQLGDVGFKYLKGGFRGCSNLGQIEGGDTSEVYTMESMFVDTATSQSQYVRLGFFLY